jgi:hypothetical protein
MMNATTFPEMRTRNGALSISDVVAATDALPDSVKWALGALASEIERRVYPFDMRDLAWTIADDGCESVEEFVKSVHANIAADADSR